jgi:hypothetical protein
MENREVEQVSPREIAEMDNVAKEVIAYSEDDRRKSDQLYEYYQKLIDSGDTKGETRESLAKALELREKSVLNLIEILKLKTRLMEKKMSLESRRMMMEDFRNVGSKRSGRDHTDLIARLEGEG